MEFSRQSAFLAMIFFDRFPIGVCNYDIMKYYNVVFPLPPPPRIFIHFSFEPKNSNLNKTEFQKNEKSFIIFPYGLNEIRLYTGVPCQRPTHDGGPPVRAVYLFICIYFFSTCVFSSLKNDRITYTRVIAVSIQPGTRGYGIRLKKTVRYSRRKCARNRRGPVP